MARRPRTPAPSLFPVDGDPAIALLEGLPTGSVVVGIDEAGRGPLAGPVVAAAVVLPGFVPEILAGLDDSKKLTERAREQLFPHIVEHALAWGIAFVEAPRIDAINILQASLAAMAEAFGACEKMLGRPIAAAGVDGDKKAPLPTRVRQVPIIGGDAKSRPIMAASILAKVSRDRRMRQEAARFPAYGFDEHKGYGTARHLAALIQHGPTPLHRMSFAPVRAAARLDANNG